MGNKKLNIESRFLALDKNLRASFSSIREEFNDHLDAINENTDELHLVNDFLHELDDKIETLSTRLDTVCMTLRNMGLVPSKIELDTAEQKVFLALYMDEHELTLEDISRKVHASIFYVEEKLQSMEDKGIPIVREWIDGGLAIRLDELFRLQQARQEVVPVSPAVKAQLNNRELVSFFSS